MQEGYAAEAAGVEHLLPAGRHGCERLCFALNAPHVLMAGQHLLPESALVPTCCTNACKLNMRLYYMQHSHADDLWEESMCMRGHGLLT